MGPGTDADEEFADTTGTEYEPIWYSEVLNNESE